MLNRFAALLDNNLTDLVINLFELYGTVFPMFYCTLQTPL